MADRSYLPRDAIIEVNELGFGRPAVAAPREIMVYTTLPGDLGALDSQGMGEGMPIWRRFAVIIRARRIDITEVMRGCARVQPSRSGTRTECQSRAR